MGVIIVAIGGYNIPQLEHRIVYIMGFLEILFKRMEKISSPCWRSGIIQPWKKVKEKISKRIWEGLHDPDPERRAQWERIPCAGEIPAPE